MINVKNVFCGVLIGMTLVSTARAELFKADTFTLDNGLECVVIQNHKAPIVKQIVLYKAGAIDEDFGRGGSAHLLEHLMFRGTKKVKDGVLNSIMTENGVESNAYTSHNLTAYHQFADISRLEILMALEADRMESLNFSREAFASEQKIVFQERKQVVENNPNSVFGERLHLLFWGNSPYGHPVTGLSDEIKSLTYEDIYNFYNAFYAPNNAILIIAGDIDTPTAKKLVEKYYGKIAPKEIKPQKVAEITDRFTEVLEMTLPDVSTIKMIDEYMLPNYANVRGSVYDYQVLSEYLSGGKTGALYRDLVINQKVAVSVNTDYTFITRGNSSFLVTALPAEGVSVEEMQEALANSLKKAVKELDAEKLAKVKRKMTADLVFTNDNPEDAAYWVGTMMANGFTLEDAQNYEKNILAVSVEGVKNAYKEVFEKASVVHGILLPPKENNND